MKKSAPNGKAALGWKIDVKLAQEFKEVAEAKGEKPGAFLERLMGDYLNSMR
jgi:hypothetical protein